MGALKRASAMQPEGEAGTSKVLPKERAVKNIAPWDVGMYGLGQEQGGS